MPPELQEIDEVSQALDYLADQTYSEEHINILAQVFNDLSTPPDYDNLKQVFAGQRGVVSRVRVIFTFCENYQSNPEIIQDLSVEIKFLIAGFQGEEGGSLSSL